MIKLKNQLTKKIYKLLLIIQIQTNLKKQNQQKKLQQTRLEF